MTKHRNPGPFRLMAALGVAVTLGVPASLAATVQATPPVAARAGSGMSLAANAAPATGATDLSDLGASGWAVQSSAVATQTGAQISTPGFATTGWLPVSNDDAGAPG